MKKMMILAVVLISTIMAKASTDTERQLDKIQNSTGGAQISVPSVGTTFTTDTNTQTMTNKTLTSPAITTPTGIVKGDVGLGNVDNTSDATKNAASVTLTNKTIASPVLSGTATGTYTLGGTPSIAATAITGQVTVPQGGTGLGTLTSASLLVGAGTGNVTFIAPGSSGNVLTSNGSVWSSAAPANAPTINNSQASPQSVTAGGGISLSTPTYQNFVFVKSNSGSVTVTATPSVTACTTAGQTLVISGQDATNVITLQDEASLAGTKLHLNGLWTSGLNNSLSLYCDGNGFWNESARYN